MAITYLTGDATEPVKTPALIMHVCNDVGGWGRGFVLALSKKWKNPERAYRTAYGIDGLDLGEVQFVPVADGITVANMIAQHDIVRDSGGNPPIRYWALAQCLITVGEWCEMNDTHSIHAPRIGCGLAGGDWSVVEPLIEFYLKDCDVYVYDLPEKR